MNIYNVLAPLKCIYTTLSEEYRPVLLYGMGDGAEKILKELTGRGIKVSGVFASDGFVRGQSFKEFEVLTLKEAEKEYGDFCAVLCFALEGEKMGVLKEIKIKHRIYSPNLPVYGDGVFDKKFILENIEKVQKVYDLLADDTSKDLFLDILKYNITGDPSYMLDKQYSFDYPDGFFIHSERHIDVGAYDGDTITEYSAYNHDYSDIVGFEPDKTNFKKLLSNTRQIRDVINENAAVFEKTGTAFFEEKGNRSSSIDNSCMGEPVKAVSIDSYCNQKTINSDGIRVGSIKVDAEGMDIQVLYGAVNTIYRSRPDLSVAVYHRASDILEIPLLIRKYDYSCRLYLRKKPYIPAWDIFILAQATKK